ncbi:GNAT family N-acetyltransferase [Paenibacillus kobensis]|uniref:GNAT family N-acetyltransferase n=1 Tax=Paenibacillus kobensis TaxID=59841 RepID=UPI000FD70DB0|nr:GNAT family N-acetyltransferase [Paenibacillus kobensis]
MVTTKMERLDELAQLLVDVVEDGASVGFLPPLSLTEAADYWRSAIDPDVSLIIATVDNHVAGTVQVQYSVKANGAHRAEIAKLMTSPKYRRRGIARALMQEAERIAKERGISLLVLDTREGDPSNKLYQSMGYVAAGSIPEYARSADGGLHATNFYYKKL